MAADAAPPPAAELLTAGGEALGEARWAEARAAFPAAIELDAWAARRGVAEPQHDPVNRVTPLGVWGGGRGPRGTGSADMEGS